MTSSKVAWPPSLPILPVQPSGKEIYTPIDHLWKINAFIAASARPNLRGFLIENDKIITTCNKIITTCNNIIYYIVNPAMRGKTRCDHRIRR